MDGLDTSEPITFKDIDKFNSRNITNNYNKQPIIQDFHHIKLFTGSANATKDLFMNKLVKSLVLKSNTQDI